MGDNKTMILIQQKSYFAIAFLVWSSQENVLTYLSFAFNQYHDVRDQDFVDRLLIGLPFLFFNLSSLGFGPSMYNILLRTQFKYRKFRRRRRSREVSKNIVVVRIIPAGV